METIIGKGKKRDWDIKEIETKIKIKLSDKSKATIIRLENKYNYIESKMPSINSIHELLNELGIEHDYNDETINIVESRTGNRSYVNNRHYGQKGKSIILSNPWLELDTSDSYYSWNSWKYAGELIDRINKNKGK